MRSPSREYTLPSFLLLLLACGLMTAMPALAQTPPPAPTVQVSGGDPGDPDVNQQVTSNVTANVTNPPQPVAEHTLVPYWSWNIGDAEYSASGQDGTFSPVTDGSQFNVVGNTDDTQANATFTATYNSDGYYEVQVIGTVRYVDPDDSSKDQGPYSNPVGPNQPDPNTPLTGYVGDANDDTSGMPPPSPDFAAPSAQVQPSLIPGTSSAKLIVKVTGIRINMGTPDVTGKTTTVYAGEPISLKATVPTTLSLNQSGPRPAEWYIAQAGVPIKNWTTTVNTGTIDPIPGIGASYLTSTSITFYFTAAATGVKVEYGGNNSTGYKSADTYFNVVKPSSGFTASYGSVAAYSIGSNKYLGLGDASKNQKGIAFMVNVSQQFGGNSHLLQIIDFSSSNRYSNSISGVASLDIAPNASQIWYPQGGAFLPVGDTNQSDSSDSPYDVWPLPQEDVSDDNKSFDAAMWLMWKSPKSGSIYVALANIPWGFSGRAYQSIFSGWVLDTSTPYEKIPVPNNNANGEPEWVQTAPFLIWNFTK